MGRRAIVAGLVMLTAVVFVAGVLVGQQTASTKAQTVATDDKAAAIKAGLVESITHFHSLLRGELADALEKDSFNPASRYGRTCIGLYFDAITPQARDDVMLGQYLRYMAPALMRNEFPKALLEDRFLDHFSQSVAATGLPPVLPAFTDSEIRDTNTRTRSTLMMIGKDDTWPYSWSGGVLLAR